jgi:hypothetical protein
MTVTKKIYYSNERCCYAAASAQKAQRCDSFCAFEMVGEVKTAEKLRRLQQSVFESIELVQTKI